MHFQSCVTGRLFWLRNFKSSKKDLLQVLVISVALRRRMLKAELLHRSISFEGRLVRWHRSSYKLFCHCIHTHKTEVDLVFFLLMRKTIRKIIGATIHVEWITLRKLALLATQLLFYCFVWFSLSSSLSLCWSFEETQSGCWVKTIGISFTFKCWCLDSANCRLQCNIGNDFFLKAFLL